MTINVIETLSNLLAKLSDGEWEHGMGITLETLDNPGWSIQIWLNGTPYEALDFEPRRIDRSEDDWVHVFTKREAHDHYLFAACGVHNLQEAWELVFDTLGVDAERPR